MTHLVITYLSRRTFDFYIRHAQNTAISSSWCMIVPIFFGIKVFCSKTIPRKSLSIGHWLMNKVAERPNLYWFCLSFYVQHQSAGDQVGHFLLQGSAIIDRQVAREPPPKMITKPNTPGGSVWNGKSTRRVDFGSEFTYLSPWGAFYLSKNQERGSECSEKTSYLLCSTRQKVVKVPAARSHTHPVVAWPESSRFVGVLVCCLVAVIFSRISEDRTRFENLRMISKRVIRYPTVS